MTDFPEAPASVSVKIKSSKGYEYLFTMRDEKVSDLMVKIKTMEAKWIEEGYTPLVQNSFGKPQVPTKPCPKHNEPMKEKTNLKGEKFFSHYRGSYPNLEYCNGSGFLSERKLDTAYPERQVNEEY